MDMHLETEGGGWGFLGICRPPELLCRVARWAARAQICVFGWGVGSQAGPVLVCWREKVGGGATR